MSSAKPGHFWELEQWMVDNDVSVRELAVLTQIGKSPLGRILCGQFVRVDPRHQRKILDATQGAIGDGAWSAFLARRLCDRSEAAA